LSYGSVEIRALQPATVAGSDIVPTPVWATGGEPPPALAGVDARATPVAADRRFAKREHGV